MDLTRVHECQSNYGDGPRSVFLDGNGLIYTSTSFPCSGTSPNANCTRKALDTFVRNLMKKVPEMVNTELELVIPLGQRFHPHGDWPSSRIGSLPGCVSLTTRLKLKKFPYRRVITLYIFGRYFSQLLRRICPNLGAMVPEYPDLTLFLAFSR